MASWEEYKDQHFQHKKDQKVTARQMNRTAKEYLGKFSFTKWGKKVEVRKVSKKNGYLYFEKLKLEEYQPGLFFSSTGEALDLITKIPTYQNTRLMKRIDDSVYKGP